MATLDASGFSAALEDLVAGRDWSADLTYEVFGRIMSGEATEVEIAAILTGLRVRGVTAAHLYGAGRVMREKVTPIPTTRTGLLDTCGTGGDGLHTFNISTATSLVVAAAGVPVAKHGNRSVSSTTGSADVLEQLGVRVDLSPERVAGCIDTIGIGFCFSPLLHAAMKFAAPVRKQLRFRTLFNMLGPLTNPARATRQLLGTHATEPARLMAEALALFGTSERSFVVCGNNELDEVCLWGPTRAFEVRGGTVTEHVWQPEDFGLPRCRPEDLRVASSGESARVVRGLLDGTPGPARDIVCANAAVAFLAADLDPDLRSGVSRAQKLLDSQAAANVLARLQQATATK